MMSEDKETMTSEDLHILRPAASYTADFGKVLWWHLPIDPCGKPVVAGSLLDRAGGAMLAGMPVAWYTHWSPLPDHRNLISEDGAQVLSEALASLYFWT